MLGFRRISVVGMEGVAGPPGFEPGTYGLRASATLAGSAALPG